MLISYTIVSFLIYFMYSTWSFSLHYRAHPYNISLVNYLTIHFALMIQRFLLTSSCLHLCLCIVLILVFTIYLSSSWGRVNQLGRSYVTQASTFWLAGWRSWEVGTGKSTSFLPPPLHYSATVVTVVSGISQLYVSWAGSVSYWMEGAAQSISEWRSIPLWWWNQPSRSYVTHTFWLIFTYSKLFYIEIYTLWTNSWR